MGPLESEKVLDSVRKDLTIENLLDELELFKSKAYAWEPQISISNKPNSDEVVFKIALGDPRKPQSIQGLTYTMSKEQIKYLKDGDALLADVVNNLVTLYEIRLKERLRSEVTKIASGIAFELRGTGQW